MNTGSSQGVNTALEGVAFDFLFYCLFHVNFLFCFCFVVLGGYCFQHERFHVVIIHGSVVAMRRHNSKKLSRLYGVIVEIKTSNKCNPSNLHGVISKHRFVSFCVQIGIKCANASSIRSQLLPMGLL